jgi:CheY-like chemotaxis protein
MKSVGEVMAMGRTFQESLQKALRGLETGKVGLDPTGLNLADEDDLAKLRRELKAPGPERLFYVADAFRAGMSVEEVHGLSFIDPWFLDQIEEIIAEENQLAAAGLGSLDAGRLRKLKRAGFSDARLAQLAKTDEGAVRNLVCQILASKGYNVLEASNGVDALLLLEQHNQPIDLIITDVIMPFMSGKEFADKAADKSKDLKVLFMSGYTDEAILPTGVLDPGVAFIQKPFTTASLTLKVREILDGKADG